MKKLNMYESPKAEVVSLLMEEVIASSGEGNIASADQDEYPTLF